MKNKISIWCYISAGISYVVGVMYCMSLIFLPIAIYAFIYGNRYMRMANLKNGDLIHAKPYLVSASIFVSIAGFPIGLLTIIPACIAGAKESKSNQKFDNSTAHAEAEPVVADEVEVNDIDISSDQQMKLSNEDLEKIEKLAKFRQQGLLSKEEFEEAKRQIIDKK